MKKVLLFLTVVIFLIACKKSNNPTPPQPPNPPVITETGLLTWSPSFPLSTDNITITLDASKGNKGLSGYSGDVYIYTGVVTDQSSGGWKYVKYDWSATPPASCKAQFLGNNKYSITINPSSFYGVPVGEKILKLAIIFRDASGNTTARNTDGSDMFLPITDASQINVRFVSPELEPKFTPVPIISAKAIGEEMDIAAISSQNANLSLTLNGVSFATSNNAKSISGKLKITTLGTQLVKVIANGSVEQSFSFLVNGTVEIAPLPAGAKDGVTFINGGTSAIFNLYAPNKQNAYVIGDFGDWKTDAKYFMKRTPDGNNWWVQIDGLDANTEYAYQYLVDGTLKIADPYCEKILDPSNDSYITSATYPNLKSYPTGKTTGIVSVMQGNQPSYTWASGNFTRPQKQNLVIYELHLRDFIFAHNYKTLEDTLSYLSTLGVNAIELMPISEFEGNNSWGYNPDFYFAPDKYYGTKNQLKSVIDKCHQRGIAVILDMVLNHAFGQSPMVQLYFDNATQKTASNNPWFNVEAKHPYNVGYDFNHESDATKYFCKNVMKFWMQEYKIDGYRFDLSKGFTQKNSGVDVDAWSAYDASRVAIWKDYNGFMKSIDNNNFYVILEHFAADQEEQELSNDGMMLWNNINYNMNEATMGWITNSNFSRGFHTTHGFSQPNNLVTYIESHDEERLMYKNIQYGNSSGSYNIKTLSTALDRQKMAAAFLFAIPGPKMIWQFGELGYDKSIDENGRTGEKPILWQYRTDAQRYSLYQTFAKMIALKKNNAVFATTNFSYDVAGAVKWIKLSGTPNVVVVGNFDVTNQNINIAFPSTGIWYDALNNNEKINISGNYNVSLAPGEYHVFSSAILN